MSSSKWRGAAGIARTASASAVAAPVIFPLYETANSEGTPQLVRRQNPFTRAQLQIEPFGKQWSWSMNNIQPNAEMLGYLLWLFLGNDSWAGGTHTLTLDESGTSEYACVSFDRVMVLSGTEPTQQLVGAKIANITLEIPTNGFARMSISGRAADLGADAAALSPSIATGANEAPLTWASYQAVGASIKLGYDGAPAADDGTVRMLKFSFTQPLADGGVEKDSVQPQAIHEGQATMTYGLEREFKGTGGLAAYQAWINAVDVELDATAVIGAHSFRTQLHHSKATTTVGGEVGVGAETIQQAIEYEADSGYDADPMATVTVVDAFGSAYS